MMMVIGSSRIANETIGAGGEDVVEPITKNHGTLPLDRVCLRIENFTVIRIHRHYDDVKMIVLLLS